jgi:hypothetical protein
MRGTPGQPAPQGRPETTHAPAQIPQHPASGEDRGAHTERTQPKEPPRPERQDQPR